MCFMLRYGMIKDKKLKHGFDIGMLQWKSDFNKHLLYETDYKDAYPHFLTYFSTMAGITDFHEIPARSLLERVKALF